MHEYTSKFVKAMTNISDLELRIALYAFQAGLKPNSPLSMDLNINEIYIIPRLLERANKL